MSCDRSYVFDEQIWFLSTAHIHPAELASMYTPQKWRSSLNFSHAFQFSLCTKQPISHDTGAVLNHFQYFCDWHTLKARNNYDRLELFAMNLKHFLAGPFSTGVILQYSNRLQNHYFLKIWPQLHNALLFSMRCLVIWIALLCVLYDKVIKMFWTLASKTILAR